MADVVVLDADAPFAGSLVDSFRRDCPGFRIEIAAASDDLLRRLEPAPRLILIDPDFGSGDLRGTAILREMRARGFRGAVFAISNDMSADALMAALLAGADGFLMKDRLRCRRCEEISRLLRVPLDAIDPFDAYLRSRGLRPGQREFLREYLASGFPEHKLQSTDGGATENAVQKRLARIRNTLDLDNGSQLVSLLVVLSGFLQRRKPKDATERRNRLQQTEPPTRSGMSDPETASEKRREEKKR